MGQIFCQEIYEGVWLWAPETEEERKAAPKFSVDVARKMFIDNFIFFETACVIKTEGDKRKGEAAKIDRPTATDMQVIAGAAAWYNKWLMVIKHRQAKMSTFFVLTTLLRDCMYIAGYQGVLIANSEDTVGQLFDRLIMAYDHLAPECKVPCSQDGKSKSVKYIHFMHGGNITIMTAGGKSIGAGWSVDRAVISEMGEMPLDQQFRLLESFIPAVAKRHSSRVVIETTPGLAGSDLERLWLDTLEGGYEAQFVPCFLRWVDDHTCSDEPYAGFENSLTDDERAMMGKTDGLQLGHLMFMRRLLKSGMPGIASFKAKYPFDEYDGWRGADDPIVDPELIHLQLKNAKQDSDFPINSRSVRIVEPRAHGHGYWIFCDSNKPGAEGDPSALTVVDKVTSRIVAFWDGREEPDIFAYRVVTLGLEYGGRDCILVFEGNSGEAFTAAKMILANLEVKSAPRLYVGRNGRGWWASDKSLARAHGRLMKIMRDEEFFIPFKSGLHQLLHYDGQKKKRMRNSVGQVHHFDVARTLVMAADLIVENYGRTYKMDDDLTIIDADDDVQVFEQNDYSINGMNKIFGINSFRRLRRQGNSVRGSATLSLGVGRNK